MRVVVLLHEPQQARLEFDAVGDGLSNVAARGVRAEHHQHVRETLREHAEIGARGFGPGIFEPDTVLAADIDTVVGPGHAVEVRYGLETSRANGALMGYREIGFRLRHQLPQGYTS